MKPPPTSDARPVVLCVDDDRPVLGALRRLLRDEPYDLVTTDRPAEALRFLSRRRVDLLIADQRMPDMRGTDLLREAWSRSPATARVVLTAYPEAASIADRLGAGLRRLITKPWDDRELKHAIRSILESTPRAASDPPATDARSREFDLRVNCRGKESTDALVPVARLLRRPDAEHASLTIRVDHLEAIRDPIVRFLQLLRHEVRMSGARVYVIDPSGYAAAYFEEYPFDDSLTVIKGP